MIKFYLGVKHAEQRFELPFFFETDAVTFNRIDDSSGYIWDVFRFSAQSVSDQ